jgi:flagellar motility protein MotE (MotC chaperone)
MRFLRDLRLIPVVALAAAALFLLKATSIVIDGGYTLIASRAALAQGLGEGVKADGTPPPAPLVDATRANGAVRGDRAPDSRGVEGRANGSGANDIRANSWVRDIYQAPSYTGSTVTAKTDAPEYTGSVAAPKPEAPAEPPKDGGHGGGHGAAPAPDKNITTTPPEPIKPAMSAGERAVLESLQQRRQELETRSRENEVRDSLLKAAEKRIEQRMQELKDMESRLQGVEKKKDEEEASKFKSLVTMYENMKAKDAAKIFDRLDMRVLIEIANAMNPRRMSDILGQMSPEAAEKLTIEIANRSGAIGKSQGNGPADLPKIEGRPKS